MRAFFTTYGVSASGAVLLSLLLACDRDSDSDGDMLEGAADAPSTIVQSSPPACPDCKIELQHSVTLKVDDMARPISGPPTKVVTASTGRRIVFHPGQAPSLFDSDGRYEGDLGRTGSGPGEYRIPVTAAFLPGDSILVLDAGLRRATVLSPDLSPVRFISLPMPITDVAILHWPDQVVAAGNLQTSEHASWPLHLLDMSRENAAHMRALGDIPGEIRAGQDAALRRHLSPADRNSVWAAHTVDYRLSLVSDNGAVLRSVHRKPEWFAEQSGLHNGSPTVPPPPFLTSAIVSGDTAWLAFRIPNASWRRAWAHVRIPPSGELAGSNRPEPTELRASRIEVLDLLSGELIASRDVDGIIVGLGADNTALIYDLDFRYHPRLRVMRLSIESP